MVLQYPGQCGQTFSTHLGGGEGRSPVRRGCGAQPRDNKFLVFKDGLFVNTKFRKDRIFLQTSARNSRTSAQLENCALKPRYSRSSHICSYFKFSARCWITVRDRGSIFGHARSFKFAKFSVLSKEEHIISPHRADQLYSADLPRSIDCL